MSKFNVGDLVEIHRNPNDETWVYFNPEMHKYLGKRATIMRVGISNSFGLDIDENEWLWAGVWLKAVNKTIDIEKIYEES